MKIEHEIKIMDYYIIIIFYDYYKNISEDYWTEYDLKLFFLKLKTYFNTF